MRLTNGNSWERPPLRTEPVVGERWTAVLLFVAFAGIFALDHATGAAPVQHLYYLPIAWSALRFGTRAGTLAALCAIALYHFANPHKLTVHYEEADVLQVAVFVAVGIIAARLASDSRRLHRLAMTDDLTGLHNLRSFELRLKALVQSARREGLSLSLLVVDVDRLKSINDVHGHLAGGSAVQTVGHLIAATFTGEVVACRYGGDEFVIALPHSPEAEATEAADALRTAVSATAPVLAGVPFPAGTLSISVGLACRTFAPAREEVSPLDDEDIGEALFRAADEALYVAKNGGRNRVAGRGSEGEAALHRLR